MTRDDAFLGGRLVLRQPVSGYRAGMDAVMLAAACPARTGQRVLELGCGAGAVLLCLGARVPGLALTGVERDAAAADLARHNAAANEAAVAGRLRIITADVAALPESLRAESFDHVLVNPPFFGPGTPAADAYRAAARQEDLPLERWLDVALRRLVPDGTLTAIHRAEALGRILASLSGRAGGVAILPVTARQGRDAGRVIVSAQKGARGPLRLLDPFVLHRGAAHLADAEDLTEHAQGVLRRGEAINLGSSSFR